MLGVGYSTLYLSGAQGCDNVDEVYYASIERLVHGSMPKAATCMRHMRHELMKDLSYLKITPLMTYNDPI